MGKGVCTNLVSTKEKEEEAFELVMEEVSIGLVTCPFRRPSFRDMKIAP